MATIKTNMMSRIDPRHQRRIVRVEKDMVLQYCTGCPMSFEVDSAYNAEDLDQLWDGHLDAVDEAAREAI